LQFFETGATAAREASFISGCKTGLKVHFERPMELIEQEFEDTLLILRRSGPAALVTAVQGGGELPRIRTAGHHPADVTPTLRAVRDQLGLETVVLSCPSATVAAGVVHRLLVLELLAGAPDTKDLNWVEPVSAEQADPLDGRDWTIPGWFARAETWITETVQRADLGHVRTVEQIRSWEFSCVLRVHTDREDLYFKGLPRAYANEPRLAHHLAAYHPGLVPEVVATSERERWLLMQACRGQCLETGAPLSAWERAAASYAELQVASTAHAERLEALGCRRRGPEQLRTLIEPLLADDAALVGLNGHGLSVDELRRLRGLRASLEAACDELADSGLPMALEHGDLWSSNVYVGADRVAFIDWTDASLSHPFFSLMPFLQSAEWDAALACGSPSEARIIDAYLEHWAPYAPRERLRRALALARPLAALHIATTYWRDIPQPHAQWWIPRMVPFFVRLALAQWNTT